MVAMALCRATVCPGTMSAVTGPPWPRVCSAVAPFRLKGHALKRIENRDMFLDQSKVGKHKIDRGRAPIHNVFAHLFSCDATVLATDMDQMLYASFYASHLIPLQIWLHGDRPKQKTVLLPKKLR
jgi:hypothetical protein